jgi:hypothetical protein
MMNPAATPCEATLIYSERIVRRAVFAFWRRTVGPGFLVVDAVLGIEAVLLAAGGDRSWRVGVLATVFLAGIAFCVAVYCVHYRNSMRTLRELGDSPVIFHADDSSFTMSSPAGSATLRWSAVKEIWQFPEAWLLLYSKSQFSILPVACLSPELRARIVQRARAAGGRSAADPRKDEAHRPFPNRRDRVLSVFPADATALVRQSNQPRPQQCLNFLPLPQGQGSLRPASGASLRIVPAPRLASQKR